MKSNAYERDKRMIEIIKNMKNADYHARKEVSSSVLKAALKSPAHLAQCLSGKGTKCQNQKNQLQIN